MRVRSDRIRSKIILKNCKYFERRREEKNTPHRSRSYQSVIHDQLPYLPQTIYIYTHIHIFFYFIRHFSLVASKLSSRNRMFATGKSAKGSPRRGRIGEEEDERSVRRSERLRARSRRERVRARTRARSQHPTRATHARERKSRETGSSSPGKRAAVRGGNGSDGEERCGVWSLGPARHRGCHIDSRYRAESIATNRSPAIFNPPGSPPSFDERTQGTPRNRDRC